MSKQKKLEQLVTAVANTETGEVIATPVDVMNLPGYPWRTQWRYDPEKSRKVPGTYVWNEEDEKYEFQKAVSVTVPGQSLPMSEIIRRYQEGRPLTQKTLSYGGYDLEEPLPDLRKMDLQEIYELKKSNDEEIARLRKEAQDRSNELKKQAELNAREKWFQQELEKREKTKKTDNSSKGEEK